MSKAKSNNSSEQPAESDTFSTFMGFGFFAERFRQNSPPGQSRNLMKHLNQVCDDCNGVRRLRERGR
jgi:hypothetical protein